MNRACDTVLAPGMSESSPFANGVRRGDNRDPNGDLPGQKLTNSANDVGEI
jgi:hypothetical protein